MCYGLYQECGNNIQRISTFENIVDEATQNGIFKLQKKISID
jgi:hypothetical protein